MSKAPWFDGYEVAARFVELCLDQDGSLFAMSSDQGIWALESAEELNERIQTPDESKGDFMGKLEKQLEGVSPETNQLASELLYLELLGENDTGKAKKQEHIERILRWSRHSIPMPPDVEQALSGGVAAYAGAKIYRDYFVRFLVRFLVHWKSLAPSERRDRLSDPSAFKSLVSSHEAGVADKRQANALVHLVFPDVFSHVISPDHRERMASAFARMPGLQNETDRPSAVEVIEASVDETLRRQIGPYEEPFLRVWWEETSAQWSEAVAWGRRFIEWDGFDEAERRYKLRIAEKLSKAREACLSDSDDWLVLLKSAFTDTENNLTSWQAQDTFIQWCDGNPDEAKELLEQLWESELPRSGLVKFFEQLPRDAARGAGTRLMFGTFLLLASDPYNIPMYRWGVAWGLRKLISAEPGPEKSAAEGWRPEELAVALEVSTGIVIRKQRELFPQDESDDPVPPKLSPEQAGRIAESLGKALTTIDEIEAFDSWIELLEELRLRLLGDGIELRDMLDAQSVAYSLVKLESPSEWGKKSAAELAAFREGKAEPGLDEVDVPDDQSLQVSLNKASGDLAAHTYLPQNWLQTEIIDLLEAQRQLIFYGPPGTGKTFVAQEVARHLVKDGGEARLVQFHPSYSYEDFFEGFRPETDEAGSLTYRLLPGPLREMAHKASGDPGSPYVLVIDEINRGNLAKIFGELFFLLEYRNSEIQLQYSRSESFALPPNLYVIGTMNTADRSIALVDSALRRRFYFVGFLPTVDPVEGVLRRWLKEAELDLEAADYLDLLNRSLDDEESSIGPAFFMNGDRSEPDLERIWKHSIKPTLEERLYGTGRNIDADFSPKKLLAQLAAEADSVDGPEDDSPLRGDAGGDEPDSMV